MSSIESIELHVRTYHSALKGASLVSINSLVNSFQLMHPILHPLSDSTKLDISALTYALLRLPLQIDSTRLILAGQTPQVFTKAGFKDVTSWPQVTTNARRRTLHFNQATHTLASFIGSISGIDDLVNLLISFQIEWNKLHQKLKENFKTSQSLTKAFSDINLLCQKLDIDKIDCFKLQQALGKSWQKRLQKIRLVKKNLRLQLLAGSWIDYIKTTQRWWKNISIFTDTSRTIAKKDRLHMSRQSIYFVSSNNHSLSNLINGYPVKIKQAILSHLKLNHPDVYLTWQQIQSKEYFLNETDFLYYAYQYLHSKKHQTAKYQLEKTNSFINIPSAHYLNINTQIFPLKNILKSKYLDSRLRLKKPKKLSKSNALIFNIDYPLGFSAFHILEEILSNTSQVKGVYVTGKAATLNSQIGDIQIPRLVFDEHTQNSYMFTNCFNKFFPYTSQNGSILTEQKAVSVLGTYLENQDLIDKYSQNDLTVIEMESGPYLGAITEATYDSRVPKGTIVDLNNAPFDIGIINYTSDTPYSQTKNLGHLGLNLKGVEPVYLSSLAILQRIINLEESL